MESTYTVYRRYGSRWIITGSGVRPLGGALSTQLVIREFLSGQPLSQQAVTLGAYRPRN